MRSAYGIFYDPYYNGQGGPLQTPISAPPYLRTAQLLFPGSLSNPFANGNPFASQFAEPMTLLTLSPQLRLPYAQDWNLTIERSFGNDWLLEVGYVGTKGTKLPRFIEGNPSLPAAGPNLGRAAEQHRPAAASTACRMRMGNCTYSSVGLIAGIANSSYNALKPACESVSAAGSLSLLPTPTRNLWTMSRRSISPALHPSRWPERTTWRRIPSTSPPNAGRSMFDARHRLVLSYVWELPFWRQAHNWYQHALGNWQVNGITTFMSGTPFTVEDQSYNDDAPEITGFSAFRPNLIGNPNSGPKTVAQWFNTSAFQRLDLTTTPAGVYGTEGRNVVQGPGLAQWDFSAFKNIQLTESKSLQFRAEFFNLFNRTNFELPNSDISSPTFGADSAGSFAAAHPVRAEVPVLIAPARLSPDADATQEEKYKIWRGLRPFRWQKRTMLCAALWKARGRSIQSSTQHLYTHLTEAAPRSWNHTA